MSLTIESRVEMMLRACGDGVYSGLCAVYANSDDTLYLIREFKLDKSNSPVAVQLVVRQSSGNYFVREYVCCQSGYWKDSDGCTSLKVADLLPSDLISAEFVASYSLAQYVIGA